MLQALPSSIALSATGMLLTAMLPLSTLDTDSPQKTKHLLHFTTLTPVSSGLMRTPKDLESTLDVSVSLERVVVAM